MAKGRRNPRGRSKAKAKPRPSPSTKCERRDSCSCGAPAKLKAVGDRQFDLVVSTDEVDCDRDRVLASAWRLNRFRRNPVVLFGHDPSKPVARATRVWTTATELRARIQFPAEGQDETADDVHGKIKAGLLRSASAGFNILESHIDAEGVRVVTSAELVEISVVALGCVGSAGVAASARRRLSKDDVRAIVRDAFAKSAPKRISKSQAVAAVRKGTVESVTRHAVAELCIETGCLDIDGLKVAMRRQQERGQEPTIALALKKCMAKAEELAGRVEQRIAAL